MNINILNDKERIRFYRTPDRQTWTRQAHCLKMQKSGLWEQLRASNSRVVYINNYNFILNTNNIPTDIEPKWP